MARSESNGPISESSASISPDQSSIIHQRQPEVTNQQLERARAKVEREQQRNKDFTARRMREIFDVDLADYEQHQPEEGVYCINFEALEDPIDENGTPILRCLKTHFDKCMLDIEKYRKMHLSAVNKFADDKKAELTRRFTSISSDLMHPKGEFHHINTNYEQSVLADELAEAEAANCSVEQAMVIYTSILKNLKESRVDSGQRFDIAEDKIARGTSIQVHYNHETYKGMNDEQFNPAHYIQLRNAPGQKRGAQAARYCPSGHQSKMIKLEKNDSIVVINSDSDSGEAVAPPPKCTTKPRRQQQQQLTSSPPTLVPSRNPSTGDVAPMMTTPPLTRTIHVNPSFNNRVTVPVSKPARSTGGSIHSRLSMHSQQHQQRSSSYLGFSEHSDDRWPHDHFNRGKKTASSNHSGGGNKSSSFSSGPKYNVNMASFDLEEIKLDAMSEIDELVGNTRKARYMGIHWSKKHRKDFVVSDILDNRLIHYNMDRKRASLVRGNDNLKQPGACCFIEHPDDKRLLTCALDHRGIVVFDPESDQLVYEIALDNSAVQTLTGKGQLPHMYLGLWRIKYRGRYFLVTLNRRRAKLAYFEPFSSRTSGKPSPDHEFTIQGVDQADAREVRFGCYDTNADRIMLTTDPSNGRGKKIIAVKPDGQLDTSFAQNGLITVPSDIAQLAGICPVIPGPEQLNGYVVLDSKGRQIIHVNMHGHFRKVRVAMENGAELGRPVQIASNGKYYVACFHPLFKCQPMVNASVKIFQLEHR